MKIYDSSIDVDVESARVRLEVLIKKNKRFAITVKHPSRSLQQNRYLHLILGWFALGYGETLEYVKLEFFKKTVNADIFQIEYVNKKTGEIRDDWRSTKDLNTGELTLAIDRFRDYSSKEAGIYLPEPRDMVALNDIERQLSNQKQYI